MFLQGVNSNLDGDRLSWLNETELLAMIRTSPDPEREAKVKRIRDIFTINRNEAEKIVKELPYFSCCLFNPLSRREENYTRSEHLCLEVPIPSFENREQYLDWRTSIQRHRNASMAFISAIGDRLLLIFNLRKPCYDRGMFRLFYREFANSFFDECGLTYIPSHPETDPIKAIPISIDPDAYLCYNVTPIKVEDYLNYKSINALQIERQKNCHANHKRNSKKLPTAEPVNEETLSHIKNILGISKKQESRNGKKNLNKDLKALDKSIETMIPLLTEKGFTINDVQILPSGRKLYVNTRSGTVVINIILDINHNRSISFTFDSSVSTNICMEVKLCIEEYLKKQE